MARQARLDAPGTLHHIMIRGIEGRDIFTDDPDRRELLNKLGVVVKESGTRVIAWALMSNHVHLLIFSGHEGISKIMRRLLTSYAIYFNRRHNRTGHLFQNRYKSIVCDENNYLSELVRYIHLNPARAGIVKSVSELNIYPWTGHAVLVGSFTPDWQDSGFVLGQFGRNDTSSKEKYVKYICEGWSQGKRPELVGGGLVRSMGGWSHVISMRRRKKETEYDTRILGVGDFVTKIMKESEKKARARARAGEIGPRIKRLIKKGCERSGISRQELQMGGRRAEVSALRRDIAGQLVDNLGLSMAEAARHLGVGTSAISKVIKGRNKST